MKTKMYIQPTTEVVKMLQAQTICGISTTIGDPVNGGISSNDPNNPVMD